MNHLKATERSSESFEFANRARCHSRWPTDILSRSVATDRRIENPPAWLGGMIEVVEVNR